MGINKKLNNKGFTLIELLAVIVVLLIISGVAISSISAAIERNKAKQLEAKKSAIVGYARLYVDEHLNTLKKNNVNCIKISSLGLDDEEKNDSNGNPITGYVVFDAKSILGISNNCGNYDNTKADNYQFVDAANGANCKCG